VIVSAVSCEPVRAVDEVIIGSSPEVIALRNLIVRIAHTSASVMIAGPSGSGKELVARAIHATSDRAAKPFVALNCGAIPADLIESELFGHEKGAFTGAHIRRLGRFEEAHQGSLFLDEIGDMRFDMQIKLLRVLEDRIVTRVGGGGSARVDVRIISATHQNLAEAIAAKNFREDLFFRLGVIMLDVPGLASRTSDIPALIEHFQRGKPRGATVQFDPPAMARLMAHHWPGNIRELRNVVERAGILFGGQRLGADMIDTLLCGAGPRLISGGALRVVNIGNRRSPTPGGAKSAAPIATVAPPKSPINLKAVLESVERERIHMAIDLADGVIAEAARLLTLKRTTLIEKMRKYGVCRID
jgi:sigma-54 specific flagellar transcriptional regulator A